MREILEAVPTVLVVESDQATRSGMKRLLEMYGYYVVVADDEHEAVKVAPHARPDLILFDSHLSPPASLSAAHRIRQYKELRRVPVLVISVHDSAKTDDFTIGYITDLSRFDELENLINRLLI